MLWEIGTDGRDVRSLRAQLELDSGYLSRLLRSLEAARLKHGAKAVRLETNKSLVEAISLYRSAGYVEVKPFNSEPYAHHWFAKSMAKTTS